MARAQPVTGIHQVCRFGERVIIFYALATSPLGSSHRNLAWCGGQCGRRSLESTPRVCISHVSRFNLMLRNPTVSYKRLRTTCAPLSPLAHPTFSDVFSSSSRVRCPLLLLRRYSSLSLPSSDTSSYHRTRYGMHGPRSPQSCLCAIRRFRE